MDAYKSCNRFFKEGLQLSIDLVDAGFQGNRLRKEMEHGCNMGTVLILHFISFMQHKNRPHVATMLHFFS